MVIAIAFASREECDEKAVKKIVLDIAAVFLVFGNRIQRIGYFKRCTADITGNSRTVTNASAAIAAYVDDEMSDLIFFQCTERPAVKRF